MRFRAGLHLQKLYEAFVPVVSSLQLARCSGCGCYAPLGVGDAVCIQCERPAWSRPPGPRGAGVPGIADDPSRAASRASRATSAT
jgi:hypothetical protein